MPSYQLLYKISKQNIHNSIEIYVDYDKERVVKNKNRFTTEKLEILPPSYIEM